MLKHSKISGVGNRGVSRLSDAGSAPARDKMAEVIDIASVRHELFPARLLIIDLL